MPSNAQIGKIINQVPSKPMLHSSQQISLLCLSYLFGDTTNLKPKSHSGMLLMAGRQVDYLAKRLFHVIALVRGSLDIGNTLTPKWALPRPFELNIFVSSCKQTLHVQLIQMLVKFCLHRNMLITKSENLFPIPQKHVVRI